jgi:hypothetical protein
MASVQTALSSHCETDIPLWPSTKSFSTRQESLRATGARLLSVIQQIHTHPGSGFLQSRDKGPGDELAPS